MFVKLLAAVALAAAPVSASAPQTTVPIDNIARAKFPADNGNVVDAVALINSFVNSAIQGESDLDHYGVADFWVQYPEDGKGDCEDYAITKLGFLQQAGFPTVTNTKIVGVIVHRKGGDEGHAILAVLLPSGAVMYLDNLRDEPATRAELVAAGYEFFDWRA